MSNDNLDIYLLNTPQPGVERATLVRNLATTFKKEVPVIEKMLRKPRSLLKANVDPVTAAKYKNAILKAGGKCELVAQGEELFPSDALNPVEPRPVLTVAPFEPTALAPVADPTPEEEESVDSIVHKEASPYSAPATNAQQEKEYFCYNCGRLIAIGWDNCPYCNAQQIQLKSKDKVTAGLLAFFLGGFGIHRFYLGQWWGIFYLLFWVTLIPSIISFIEALVFWFTSKQTWQHKYGHVPETSTGFKVAIGVAGVVAFFFVVGILAAVSLPAYQDYTARAKVHQGMSLVNQTRDKVTDVINEKHFYPTENLLAGLPEKISNEFVSSITLGEGAQMTVKFRIPHLEPRNQNSIVWTPAEENGVITWNCLGGSMPDKYRVMECRGGSGAVDSSSHNTQGKGLQNKRFYSDDKRISLTVPDNWKGNRNLNDVAILGVANQVSQVFAIVIDEDKNDFDSAMTLTEYLGVHAANMETELKDFHLLGPSRSLQLKNRPARQQVISGIAGGLKITYLLTAVETDTHFYIVYAWTLSSLFERHQPLLNKVSTSFTVHNPGGE